MTAVTLTFAFASAEEAAAFLAGKSAAPTAAPSPAPAAAPAAAKAEKPAKPAKTEPEGPTADEVTAAMNAVKDKFGAPAAKAIIQECGFAKLAELVQDAAARAKAKAACDAKLAGGDDDM